VGRVEGETGAAPGREEHYRLADDGRESRSGFGSGKVNVPERGDRYRVVGAVRTRCGGTSSVEQRRHLLLGHHAVVRAVAAAAGGEVGLRPLSERERGQQQRKAEDGQQQEAQEFAHGSSVTEESALR